MNAHIIEKSGKHFRKHKEVNDAINPESRLSPAKVDEEVYLANMKLQNLARRARYLVNEKISQTDSEKAYLTI